MADLNQPANFTEVAEIRLDVAKFAQDINAILQEYERLRRAVQAPVAIGVGNVDGKAMADSLNKLSQSLNDFQAHQAQVMNALTQTIVENTDKQAQAIENVFDRIIGKGQKVKQASIEATQQQVAAEVAAVEAGEEQKKKLYQYSELEQRAQFKKIQDNPALVSQLDDKELDFLIRKTKADQLNRQKVDAVGNQEAALAEQIELRRQALVAKGIDQEQIALNKKFIAENNNIEQTTLKRNEAIAKGADFEQVALNKKFIKEQDLIEKTQAEKEGAVAKGNDLLQIQLNKEYIQRIENEEKIAAFKAKVIANGADLQQIALNRQFIAEQKAAETNSGRGSVEDQRTINIEREISKRQQILESIKLQEVESEKLKGIQATAIANLEKEIALRQRQLILQQEIAAASRSGNTVVAQTGRVDASYSAKDVAKATSDSNTAINQFKKLSGTVEDVDNKIKNAGKSQKGFYDTLTGNLPGLVGHVIKFALAWKAVNLAIEGIIFLPKEMFAAFENGIKYLETIQNRTADIKEALQENVVFSAEWRQNLRLAGDAAAYATQKIQEAAAKAAIDPEKIEAGFKSLVQAGGLKLFNNDIAVAVDTTTKLISLLRARGVSDNNQRRLVTEINDLMTGHVKKTSAILQALGYTVDQWKKIQAQAKDTGDLYQLIEDRLAGSNERIATADQRFTDLTHQLKLYRNEVEGAFASGIYQIAIDAMAQLARYFRDNREKLLEMAQAAGQVVGQTAQMLLNLTSVDGVIPNVLSGFAQMAIYLSQFVNQILYGYRLARNIVELIPGAKKLDPNNDARNSETQALANSIEPGAGENPALVNSITGGPSSYNPFFGGKFDKYKAGMEALRAKWKAEDDKNFKSFDSATQEFLTQSTLLAGTLDNFKSNQADILLGILNKSKTPEQLDADKMKAIVDKEVEQAREELNAAKLKKSSADELTKAQKKYDLALKDQQTSQEQYKQAYQPKIIGNTGKTIEDDTKPEKGALQALKESIAAQLAEVKRYEDSVANSTKTAEAERVISIEQGSKLIIRAREQELKDSLAVLERYRSAVNNPAQALRQGSITGAEADAISKLTASQRLALVADITKQEANLRRQAEASIEQAEKESANARRAILEEEFKSRIAIIRQNTQNERQVIAADEQGGYITKLEALQRTSELDRQEHELTIKALEEERSKFAVGTLERIKLTDQMLLEDTKYSGQVINNTRRRIEAQEAELRLQRQRGIEAAQNAVDRTENRTAIPLALGATGTERLKLENQLTDSKLRLIDVTIKAAQADLLEAEAMGKNADELYSLNQRLIQLFNERQKLVNQKAIDAIGLSSSSNSSSAATNAQSVLREQTKQLQKVFNDLVDQIKAIREHPEGQDGKLSADQAKKLGVLGEQAHNAAVALAEVADAADKASTQGFAKAKDKLLDGIFGGDNIKVLQDENATTLEKFGAAANAAATGLQSIMGIINQYEQGRKQGGVLGGIGSLLSSGPISDALSAIPVVGAFVKPVGAILSFFGSMFQAAAAKIANEIKAKVQKTMQDLNLGNIGIAAAIAQLQAERDDAIRRLSGKKGGKDQLNKLLPDIDQQLAQLKKQAAQIISDFNSSLAKLRLPTGSLQEFYQTWVDINKQVKDYLDAGGDAAKAQEFLSLSLLQQQKDLQKQLNDGQQQAIQDAINLNDLLKQRTKLQEDYNKQVFDIVNAGALERQVPGYISRGLQLQQATKDYNDQLASLNEQITLATSKLDIEKQVYNISSDITTLHRQDDALTLLALQAQIDGYKQIKTILGGIVTDSATGATTLIDSLLKLLGLTSTGILSGTSTPTPTGTPTNPYGGGGGPIPIPYVPELKVYGEGGVVGEPQMAIVGDTTEAIIPLKSGAVPVTLNFGLLFSKLGDFVKTLVSTKINPIAPYSSPGSSLSIGSISVSVQGNFTDPAKAGATIADEISRRLRYGQGV